MGGNGVRRRAQGIGRRAQGTERGECSVQSAQCSGRAGEPRSAKESHRRGRGGTRGRSNSEFRILIGEGSSRASRQSVIAVCRGEGQAGWLVEAVVSDRDGGVFSFVEKAARAAFLLLIG